MTVTMTVTDIYIAGLKRQVTVTVPGFLKSQSLFQVGTVIGTPVRLKQWLWLTGLEPWLWLLLSLEQWLWLQKQVWLLILHKSGLWTVTVTLLRSPKLASAAAAYRPISWYEKRKCLAVNNIPRRWIPSTSAIVTHTIWKSVHSSWKTRLTKYHNSQKYPTTQGGHCIPYSELPVHSPVLKSIVVRQSSIGGQPAASRSYLPVTLITGKLWRPLARFAT